MRKNIIWLIVWILLGTGSVYGSYFWFLSQKTHVLVTLSLLPTSSTPTPVPQPFVLDNAPEQSLVASVGAQIGEVTYISRIATEAAKLDKSFLVQGESVLTGADGHVQIQFPASLSAQLLPESRLNLIQTLPHSVVLEQQLGMISYQNPHTVPTTVRVKRLLVDVSQADVTITYQELKDAVLVSVIKGEAVLAYNDAQFVSQVATISAGKRVTFDNTKRKLRVN